jgi:hypothetical protein
MLQIRVIIAFSIVGQARIPHRPGHARPMRRTRMRIVPPFVPAAAGPFLAVTATRTGRRGNQVAGDGGRIAPSACSAW